MNFLANKSAVLKSFVLSISLIFSACGGRAPISHYVLENPTHNPESRQSVQNNQEEQYNQHAKNKNIKLDNQSNNPIDNPVICILPVAIPSYLDRLQLVTRTEELGLTINESNRWGEYLSAGIARVLGNSITANLSEINAFAIPLRMGIVSDYTIQVEISNFEGSLEDEVKLSALWILKKGREKIWQSTYNNSVLAGSTFSSYAQAYASLVDAFGEEIAKTFYTIYTQKKK